MITIYKTTAGKLDQLETPVHGSWISVINPDLNEIQQMVNLGLPEDYLTYPLDLDELARTERENGERLIVLRIPYYAGETEDIPYNTIPLGIILNPQWVVTVCKLPNDIVDSLINGRTRSLSTGKPNRFVLRLLLRTAERYLTFLREINRKVDEVEDRLQRSTKNKELLELLKYQKSLTLFTTALKSNELMMERLQRSQIFHMYPEDEDLLEDVLTENQQAIQMTDIATNILSAMMDSFASIISNNLNDVMKILASITIVASLPNIIFSFFGMNLNLHIESYPFAALAVATGSLLVSLLALWFFYRRDWL